MPELIWFWNGRDRFYAEVYIGYPANPDPVYTTATYPTEQLVLADVEGWKCSR